MDGAGPDDGVAGCGGLGDRVGCWRVGGDLLGADLLVDLLEKLLGELHLGRAAVPAEDMGALIFAIQDSVAAGTDA
jgi:hypothetical protein